MPAPAPTKRRAALHEEVAYAHDFVTRLCADPRVSMPAKSVGAFLWSQSLTARGHVPLTIPYRRIGEMILSPGADQGATPMSYSSVRRAIKTLEEADYITVDRARCGRGHPPVISVTPPDADEGDDPLCEAMTPLFEVSEA